MKTTIPGMILSGLMACTLAACDTTPMNNDSTMGSSSAGTTASSAAKGDNTQRGAMPVNCTNSTNTDGTAAPGTNCPTEAH